MSLTLFAFETVCLLAFVFSVYNAFLDGPEHRREAAGYALKWTGILAPWWLFLLVILYAIVAGNYGSLAGPPYFS